MTQIGAQSDSGRQHGKRLAELVAARYGLLNVLSQGERFAVSDLVSGTGEDRGNLSRYMTELEEGGLVVSFDEPSEKLGRPKKFYRLTELGKKLLAPFTEASKPVELLEPDAEEIRLLIRIINSGSAGEEVRRIAIRDLINLSGTTRIWKLKFLMKFLEEGFAKESLRLVILDLIRTVCGSAIRDGDKKTAQDLLQRYSSEIAAMVRDSAEERHLRGSAMLTYMALQDANESKHSKVMTLSQYLVEDEHNDQEFNDVQPYVLLWLKDFWKENSMEARKWLYHLMQNSNQTVVKRAIQLHSALVSSPT